MRRPSLPPGWRRLPLGLLGMIALVAVLEARVFRNNPEFGNEHSENWAYAGRQGVRTARGRDVLVLGDSLAKFGLLPSVLRERAGRSAYNLALFSGPTPASYFLLRRALAEGAHPSAIVIDCVAGILGAGPRSRARNYPWAELLRASEAVDLAWSSRDPDLLVRLLLAGTLHSVKDRFEIRLAIRCALCGMGNHRRVVTAINHRNWRRNDGAQAQAKREFKDDPIPHGQRPRPTWKPDPVNEAYLARVFALAARHKIQVYWLIPPFSPGAHAHYEFRGEYALYDAFAARMMQRFPGIVVIDARYAGYPQTAFFDNAHLHWEGAASMSASVAEVLARPAPEPGRRWVRLPAPQPATALVEDTDGSTNMVKLNAQRLRR